MPAKKAAKKATAKKATVKKAAKKAPAKKAAAVKNAAPAKKKFTASMPAKPSIEAIARKAYVNYLHRVQNGLPGDAHQDWLAAESELSKD